MKSAVLSLMLFAVIAGEGSAQTLRPMKATVDRITDQRLKQELLGKARSVNTMDDGSEWLIHPVWTRQEGSPTGVTRFSKDGASRLFLASDWLPKEAVPRGFVGQIYSVAQLPAGRVAASIGWNDGASHNAILLLSPQDDGGFATQRVIEVPGVGQIIAGPASSILALTDNASIAGGGPALTLFSAGGEILGEFFERDPNIPTRDAVNATTDALLQRIAPGRYAMFDPIKQQIHVFDLAISPGAARTGERQRSARLTPRQAIFVDVDAQASSYPVVAMTVSAEGTAFVARTGVFSERPCTRVTGFGSDGRLLGSWMSKNPWHTVARSGNGFTGTSVNDAILVEHVEFSAVD